MANYSLSANRNSSDIDGLGTELDSGDTVTTNAFTLTHDAAWTNRACDDITVSLNGGFINEAGVNVTYDNAALISVAGTLEIRGTSGSTVTWDRIQRIITSDEPGLVYANYLILTNVTSYGITNNGGSIFIFNSTLMSGDAIWGLGLAPGSAGICYLENCSITSASTWGSIQCGTGRTNLVYFVDCTFTCTHANNWWATTRGSGPPIIYILGTTNFEGAEPNDSNMTIDATGKPTIYYYSRIKATIEDGSAALENAMLGIYHKAKAGHVMYSLRSVYPNFSGGRYGENYTDANGVVRCFALSKVYNIDTWAYISDENQAEAGDNSPYYVNAMYPDYQSPAANVEAWGIENGNGSHDETNVGTIDCLVVTAGLIANPKMFNQGFN